MIFGRKKKPQHTYKSGVTQFWDWFPTVADRFYKSIEDGDCESLTDEMVGFMESSLPRMSWVFGPGEDGGHSLTVSGEGVVVKQLLAEFWHRRQVEVPGWTFYASRQPCDTEKLKSLAISVSEQEQVEPETFLIQTDVDEKRELIDIVAWHPALKVVPEEHHLQILFLLLDEALGEFGTQTWIGGIEIQPLPADAQTRTLTELPEYIGHVNRYHGWEKLPPPQTYTVYEFRQQSDQPRGDTIVGTSIIPDVVGEYVNDGGKLADDPLEGTGAELMYLKLDMDVFPDGKQSDVRGNIEDALDEALGAEDSGRTLGGAFGTNHAYIDLLLVDGEPSREIVESTMKQLQLTNKSSLEPFA